MRFVPFIHKLHLFFKYVVVILYQANMLITINMKFVIYSFGIFLFLKL